jgi:5'-nucleotidase
MPRSGTLVICVHNLDFSGANQTVLHIVNGRMHESNVIVLSPKIGSFAARYVESGAAVRIGDLPTLLDEIRDVFCIICNTIMTADVVLDVSKRPHPVIWIIHEWWDDEMIVKNLKMRNMSSLTLQTVKEAFCVASMIIFVCESQRQLYQPKAPSTVIFVGVPPMCITHNGTDKSPAIADKHQAGKVFTILVLGIVCPRKNQLWAIKLFKKFATNLKNAKLLIVGARYTRAYEAEYVEKLRKERQDDPRIEIIDVTSYVDQYYAIADCLLVTSINEVTPMVIPEAMSWGIPILSTNIAGIPEMFTHGVEGFQFKPFDDESALTSMKSLYDSPLLRKQMGCAGKVRYAEMFDLDGMVDRYRQVLFDVAAPVVLLDMDGTIVDWDQGFLNQWRGRSYIDRGKSYRMEECVDPALQAEAVQLIYSKGLFENLPPMDGAIDAINEMLDMGLKIFLCTAPIMKSAYCAQEKINWVRDHLGDEWLDKLIMTVDKVSVCYWIPVFSI